MPQKVITTKEQAMDWLHERTVRDGHCLIWQGHIDKYGAPRARVPWIGGSVSVRRHIFERMKLRKLGNRFVCMSCNNPLCVAPLHMEAVSKPELFARASANGSFDNPAAKARRSIAAKERGRHYSQEAKARVLSLRDEGKTYRQIAEVMGMDFRHIGRICTGKAWADPLVAANASVFHWRGAA
jgi:hypothetical protein